MKTIHTQTRWYFSARQGAYALEGYVEFAVDHNKRKRADVYSRAGAKLWSTYGIQRRDRRTAQMAFEVYANLKAAG